MRQPARRAFLGTTATLFLSGAGCLGGAGGRDSPAEAVTPTDTSPETQTVGTETPAPRAVGTEQSVAGVSVQVSNLAVRDAVLYLDTPDSMALASREDEQYVLVSVSGSESGPPPDAFSLHLDDDPIGPADIRGNLDGYGPRYDPSYSGDEGYLPFAVPVETDATEGRIVVESGGETATWRLEDSTLDALRRAKAAFELRTVELPDRIRRDSRTEVRVVAENVSDVAGVFRGVLNVAGLGAAYVPYAFELDAGPGETVTWEKTFDEHPPDVVDSVGFHLYTVAGDREIQATVAGEKTERPTESSATTADGTATPTATPE